jgi:serine/threonine-protein kinase
MSSGPSHPSGPPAPHTPYRPYQPPSHPQAHPQAHPQPMSGAKQPESSAGRQVLIVLAVVLGLLVLLCAGVISFLVKQGQDNALPGPTTQTTVVRTGVADSEPPVASYRLTMQTGANPGWFRANEGRQTL